MKNYLLIFKKLVKEIGFSKKYTIELVISSMCAHISSLFPPIATSGIIGMITGKDFFGIFGFVFLYCLFYAFYFSTTYWNNKTYAKLADYYHIGVQKKLIKAIENVDIESINISKGQVIETCSDDIRYLVDVIDCSVESFMNLLKLGIIIIIFLYYNIYVGIMVIMWLILYIVFMNDNSKEASYWYKETRKSEDKVVDIINHMLGKNKVNKRELNRHFKNWSNQYENRYKKVASRYGLIPIIIYSGKIFLYIFLAYLVINEKMELDKLILLISYFEMIILCTDNLFERFLELGNYGVRVERIDEILKIN